MSINWPFWAQFHLRLSQLFAVALGFLIPLSTSLSECAFGGVVVTFFLSRQFDQKWQTLKRNPVAWWCLALILLMFLGLFYTPAAWPDAREAGSKYRKLFAIPILVLVMTDTRFRLWSLRAFQAAMLITLGGSLLIFCGLLETKYVWEPGICAVFKNYLTQNLLMAFFVFTLIHDWANHPRFRIPLALLIATATANILIMLPGRTGQLLLIVLMCLALFQLQGIRGFAVASVTGAVLLLAAFFGSAQFRHRVETVAVEFQQYQENSHRAEGTSVGERLQFYQASWHIGKEHPWIGFGPGGFRHAYRQHAAAQGIMVTYNAHNQYLQMFVQCGVLGVLLFVGLLASQWRNARHLTPHHRRLVEGLVAFMVIGCLLNSLLIDVTEGYLFVYFTGICFAELHQSTAENATLLPFPEEAETERKTQVA